MSDTPAGDLRRPTIYDVAERAGVSKSLVSLVLRRSPKVSDRRKAAVLSAIADLGYQPSRRQPCWPVPGRAASRC